jgi:DNA-directed RNA polymerase subunit RPC12/RpoP
MYYCFNCGAWVDSYIDDRGQRRCEHCDTLVSLSKP